MGLTYFGFELNRYLKSYVPLGELSNYQWKATVNVASLKPEVVEIARYAKVGERPEYLDAWFDQIFLSDTTRLELGLQSVATRRALDKDTSPALFLCEVFGCQYKSRLLDMLSRGILSPTEYRAILNEADSISSGKHYWNCLTKDCVHPGPVEDGP